MESNQSLNSPVFRVVVVDDHPWVRKGLLALLSAEEDFLVCGEAEDAQSAAELIAAAKPDIATIDISLKGDVDGLQLTRQLKVSHPNLLVLTLSLHSESEYEALALAAGASAYLCKSDVGDCLLDTIRRMIADSASKAGQ